MLHQLVWTYHPQYSFYPPGPELRNKTGNLDAMGLFKVLLDHGANPNARQYRQHPMGYKLGQIGDISGITPLMLATRFQDVELMKLLLEKGADPKAVARSGHQAHSVAVDLRAPPRPGRTY